MSAKYKILLIAALVVATPSCLQRNAAQFVAGIVTAAAGEAVYEAVTEGVSAQELRQNWRADVVHPTNSSLISTDEFGHFRTRSGYVWSDTRTTEPREVQF